MKRYLKEAAVYVLLGGITAGGVQLVRVNRSLADQNRVLVRRAIEPHAGLFVPPYPTATVDGAPVTLGALGHRQVLIFFRTTCPYCRASTPAWNALAERFQEHTKIAVYGVALDSAGAARAYAAERKLRFPVIAQPDPRLVGSYRVSSVPLILVVNDDGRMAYARLGVLDQPSALDSVIAAARASPASAAREAGERGNAPRGRIKPY